MRRGVADLHRRAQISQKSNERCLDSLAAVEETQPLGFVSPSLFGQLTAILFTPLCSEPRRWPADYGMPTREELRRSAPASPPLPGVAHRSVRAAAVRAGCSS